MTTTTAPPPQVAQADPLAPEQASRVMRVLENYLAQLEQGVPPHPDQLLAEHPDLAEHLQAYLASLEFIHRAALSLHSGEQTTTAGTTTCPVELGDLGDFRIVREIGRGGMGVVYEAEQISLKRRVALKVLPFASTLDSRQLQRFKNEAQAAACLHHTNIVPVFATGCERGVHFYAMQFIEGQTLAEVVAELKEKTNRRDAEDTEKKQHTSPKSSLHSLRLCGDSFFRQVAQVGIQAAEALDHAHEMGIVHRDVKPANLMLDHRGNLWITDFGLAQFSTDAKLTMTGDLLGTLRYMSPEQALAQRVIVDHRTDVYSLGATLYELLTLQPVFDGKDRQEVLRQIAFEEPRGLRKINKAIPAELETIVLKAMEKDPRSRYGTAQELADDLRRFLTQEPIRARRPNLTQRLVKWSRRHTGVVRAALVACMALLALASASTVVIWRKVQEVRVEKQRAEDVLDVAYQVLDEIYVGVAEKDLPRKRELTAGDRDVLDKARRFYEQFAEMSRADASSRHKQARAYRRLGDIHQVLGQHKPAQASYRQAIDTLAIVLAESPEDGDAQESLARCYNDLGGSFVALGEFGPAEDLYRKAIAIRTELLAIRGADSELLYQQAKAQSNLGTVLARQERTEEAIKACEKALAIHTQLQTSAPGDVSHVHDYVLVLS